MSNLTVATFKTWKRVDVTTDDTVIQAAIDSAEEAINAHCGRKFAVAGASSARVFATKNDRQNVIEIDDCTTVATVTDNGGTLTSGTHFQLEPLNGLDQAGMAVPYTRLRLLGGGFFAWQYGQALLSVTATWGWSALPARYTEATKILTADLLDNRDVRNGVIGFTEYAGVRVKENPVVSGLLSRLVRGRSFGVA